MTEHLIKSHQRPRPFSTSHNRKANFANLGLNRELNKKLNTLRRERGCKDEFMKRQIDSLKTEIIDRQRELEEMRIERNLLKTGFSTRPVSRAPNNRPVHSPSSSSSFSTCNVFHSSSFCSGHRPSYYSVLQIPTDDSSNISSSVNQKTSRPRTAPPPTKKRQITFVGSWLSHERRLSKNIT